VEVRLIPNEEKLLVYRANLAKQDIMVGAKPWKFLSLLAQQVP
jgi:hypothetical protein